MAGHEQGMALPVATGYQTDKGIELFSWGTANGLKASIFLEELKEAYGTQYTAQAIHLPKGVQKQPWFLACNPNGRIPAIVDHDSKDSEGKPLSVGEVTAILLYLARHYDPEGKFWFKTPAEVSECDQWLSFSCSELSATGGSLIKFYRFLPTYQPFSLALFYREMSRIYSVLDKHLSSGREYLVGSGTGKYSIADIANFTYVNASMFLGVGELGQWPHLEKWCARIWARSAVKSGSDVLYPAGTVNERMLSKQKADKDFDKTEGELKERLMKALEENPPAGPPGAAKK